MKKLLVTFSLSLQCFCAFSMRGNPQHLDKYQKEALAKEISKNIALEIEAQADSLNEDELASVILSLRELKKQLARKITLPRRGPRRIVKVACSQDQVDLYQQTFYEFKDFADSSEGLNMFSLDAKSFTLDFLSKYTCQDALKFKSNYLVLVNFADHRDGLNMFSLDARKYAKEKAYLLCPNYPLEIEFQKNYEFADSRDGLNMFSLDAKKYAKEKLEQSNAFSCQI